MTGPRLALDVLINVCHPTMNPDAGDPKHDAHNRHPVRLALAAIQITVMTVLAVLLVRGDGPGSGQVIASFSQTRGLNAGDVPVLVLWALGAAASALGAKPR